MGWLNVLIAVFMLIGMFFILIGSIGVVRMPDLYMRLSAAAKASTLGTSFLLLGVALYFGRGSVTGQVAAIIVFLVLTIPVAAHMISRAAYFNRVPLWKESVHDDLRHTVDRAQERKGRQGQEYRGEERRGK